MKKSVYNYSSRGTNFSIDMEILMDVNRELTDTDENNLRVFTENIVKSIHEESIHLNPESKKQAEKERTEILSIFGNRSIFVEEIPNGYCPNYCCKHLPWFVVTTSKGRIKIGWRKRVISIDWQDSIIDKTSEGLFPNEDVTRYDKVVHAYGYEKAKEYIDVLLS